MKKIMFNDKYRLTDAVLKGKKTMTRRVARYRGKKEIGFYRWPAGKVVGDGQYLFIEVLDPDEFSYEPEQYIRSQYHVGEIVAVAQKYKDVPCMCYREAVCSGEGILTGWNNKLFAKAKYMPHHIRITSITAQELQDISEEDALREGIHEVNYCENGSKVAYIFSHGTIEEWKPTAREAFLLLMDKIRKKPKKAYRNLPCEPYNPIVFVYEFELVD